MSTIVFSRAAARYLARMPRKSAMKLLEKIEGINYWKSEERHIKRLKGRKDYRLRVGSLRVVFRPGKEEGSILIVDIGPRGDIYK